MKSKYILASMALTLGFTACQDMDLLPEGDVVTGIQKDEVVANDPTKLSAKVNGVFSLFSQRFPNSSALGADRHNDIGYPTIMLVMGSNGEDEISENNSYNWTGFSLTYEDRVYSSLECQMVWNDLYSIIFAANNVIGSISKDTKDPSEQYYLAQGAGARAFSYLVLAQLYQFNYKGNEDKPCVPIITEENAESAPVDGVEVSTVKSVYERIDTDLKIAIAGMTAAKAAKIKCPDKRYISLAVAYGLQARMYLAMHKYAEAADAADKAIKEAEADKLSMTDITGGNNHPSFMSSNESNWMWGIIVKETDGVVLSGICNWPSHMGSLNYGYANYSKGRQISEKLFAQIKDGDERKAWWIQPDMSTINGYLNESQKSFVTEYGYKPYTQIKFAPYNNVTGTSINSNDIPLMRLEEMYLIKAEGLAMSGRDGLSVLNQFLKKRTKSPESYTANISVQDAVYLQRRIEFWGEGICWFDVMRLGKGIDRRGCGYPDANVKFVIEPTDNILLWRIPEAEIQSNPKLSEKDALPTVLPTAVKE